MIINQLLLVVLFVLIINTFAAQLKYPFKQCSRMQLFQLSILLEFSVF